MATNVLDHTTETFRARVRDRWIENCSHEERLNVERAELLLEEAWFSPNQDPTAFVGRIAETAVALENARKHLEAARSRMQTLFESSIRWPEAFDVVPLAVPSPDETFSDPLRSLSLPGRLPKNYSITVHKP